MSTSFFTTLALTGALLATSLGAGPDLSAATAPAKRQDFKIFSGIPGYTSGSGYVSRFDGANLTLQVFPIGSSVTGPSETINISQHNKLVVTFTRTGQVGSLADVKRGALVRVQILGTGPSRNIYIGIM